MGVGMTYHERAAWYDSEIIEDVYVEDFLKKIKKKYQISSCINIPCGSGQYINIFEKLFMQTFFLDIDTNMICLVNRKIKYNQFQNIVADIGDLRKPIKYNADLLIVFHQALQMLPFGELDGFLNNMSKYCFLLLDLYDFRGKAGDSLNYYKIDEPTCKYYKTREFIFQNRKIIRYTMANEVGNGIDLHYKYIMDDEEIESKIHLYYYNFIETIKKVKKNGIFHIEGIYSDYMGTEHTVHNRFILLLRRC